MASFWIGSNVLAEDGDHHYVVLNLSNMKGEVHVDGSWCRLARAIRCRDSVSMLRETACQELKDSAAFRAQWAARSG